MRFLRLLVCLLLGTLALAACGSGASSPSSSAAAPTTAPDATFGATSAPAAGAGATSAPAAAAPTSAPAAAATAAPAIQQTPVAAPTAAAAASGSSSGQITFGALAPYTDPQGVFTLNVPQGWTTQTSAAAGEATTTFTDPTGNGTLTAHVVPAIGKPDAAALQQTTSAYLQASLKDVANLRVTNQAQGADGTLPFDYLYERSVNGKAIPFRGGGYSALRGTLIAFVFYDAPADQWATVNDTYAQIAKSYTLVPGASIKK